MQLILLQSNMRAISKTPLAGVMWAVRECLYAKTEILTYTPQHGQGPRPGQVCSKGKCPPQNDKSYIKQASPKFMEFGGGVVSIMFENRKSCRYY